MAPVLVACIGNEFAGDDAFGPLVARALAERSPEGVEAIDLATKPYGLLDHLGSRKMLIIVDAADVPGAQPGELFQCAWDSPDRPALLRQRSASTHGISVAEQMELAARLGMLPPQVVLIAAQAGRTDMGDSPCAAVCQSVREAVNRICALARTVSC